MSNIEPYSARPAEFLREESFNGWRLKVYAIATGTGRVTEDLVSSGLDAILSELPLPASTDDRYGAGFVIIHRGILRNWFTLAWWEYADILFHKLFSSPLDDIENVSAEKSPAIACVHELKVINFESEAWIDTALSKNGDPDFDDYLRLRLEG